MLFKFSDWNTYLAFNMIMPYKVEIFFAANIKGVENLVFYIFFSLYISSTALDLKPNYKEEKIWNTRFFPQHPLCWSIHKCTHYEYTKHILQIGLTYAHYTFNEDSMISSWDRMNTKYEISESLPKAFGCLVPKII